MKGQDVLSQKLVTPELDSKINPQELTIAYKVPYTDELIANEITYKVENESIDNPIYDEEVVLNEYEVAVKDNY